MSGAGRTTSKSAFRPGRAALGAAVMLLAAMPAAAQDQRRKVTDRLNETEIKIQKATTDEERRAAEDLAECCRHELGYADADGKPLVWAVSYQGPLIAPLEAQLKELEGSSGGGWGLLPPGDDARRAWRILARSLLERAGREGDGNERARYAFAGMLLVHNADALDALSADLAVIQAARKAVPDGPQHDGRRRVLDRGLAGADDLTKLCRDILAGKAQMGHGELRRLSDGLARIHDAALALEPKTDPQPAGPPPPPPPTDEELLKRIDDLAARAGRLAGAPGEMVQNVSFYLEQVRVGLAHPQAHGLAVTLLNHVDTAVGLQEALSASRVVSDGYRAEVSGQLADAVKRIGDLKARDEAYRNIRDMANRDAGSRGRLEALPIDFPTKRRLWRGWEWAEGVLKTQADDQEHKQAEQLRHVLGRLVWRSEQLFAEREPAERNLVVVYRKGVKTLEDSVAAASRLVEEHKPDSEQACWQTINVINELDTVRRTSEMLMELGRYTTVPDATGKACAAMTNRLFDADESNDQQARDRLRDARDGLRLLIELHQATVPRDDLPEAAKLSRSKYYASFTAQAGRAAMIVKGLLDGQPEERNALRDVLPLYRLMAEWMILRRAEAQGRLDQCRAIRWATFDPKRLMPLRGQAADRLGPVFGDLARTRHEDLGALVEPLTACERICRTAVAGMLELRRETNQRTRIDVVIDNLRRSGQDDPGNEARQRWWVNWHANQAIEAYGRGYRQTGDWHAYWVGRNNDLYNVPLSVEGEPN